MSCFELFQLYLAYKLLGFIHSETCEGLWQVSRNTAWFPFETQFFQVWALSLLLGLIAGGNIVTTSMVCLRKLKTSPSYANIVSLTRKYSSRHKMSQPSDNDEQPQKPRVPPAPTGKLHLHWFLLSVVIIWVILFLEKFRDFFFFFFFLVA